MKTKTDNWSDWLNPVFIKEMRQFFHNKLFLSVTAVLLVVQLLLITLFNTIFREGDSVAANVFISVDTWVMYLCVFVTAAYGSMERFMAERSSRELDFTNITLLSPWQIIAGKLAAALVIWLLTAALCFPFMAAACIFCKLPLKTFLVPSGVWSVAMLVMIQAAIFCGAVGKKWMYGIYLYFVFQFALPIGICFMPFQKTEPSLVWLTQGGGVLLFLFLFASATAIITPPRANRMFPLRLLLLVITLPVFAAITFLEKFGIEEQMLVCCTAMITVSAFGLLAACDRDEPGPRVLAGVPENPLLKLMHYLLSSNRCGGILLALLVQGIFGVVMFLISFYQGRSLGIAAFGVCGYILFYSEIGILLNRKYPSISGWGGMLLAAVFLGLLPLLIAARSSISIADIVISPFSLFSADDLTIRNMIFWIAPTASWLTGSIFIAETFRNWRSYCRPR